SADAAGERRRAEEAARDRQRHEAVKRELDTLGLAATRRQVVIQMYSTSWCGVWRRARDYMHEKNIPFSEFDIQPHAAAPAQAHVLNPRASVPTISVDGDVLIGFSPDALEARIERAAKRRKGS